MSDYGNVEMVIRAERKVVLFRLILSAVLMAAFAGTAYLKVPEEYSPWAAGFVVVGWLCFVNSLLRIFATGTAFTLTDRGLLAHVGDIDFVAWGEIEKAYIVSGGSPAVIKLDLRDIETVLARLSVFRRALLRGYIKHYGEKPNLYASFGEGGAERLLQLIRQRIDVRHAGRAGGARPLQARQSFENHDSPPKSFTRLWHVATFGYMALLIVPFYGYSNWGWDIPNMPLVMLLAVAPIFVSLALLAIYTGEVQVRGSTFYRSRDPITYWLCVAMVLSGGIFLFLGGIGIIGQ